MPRFIKGLGQLFAALLLVVLARSCWEYSNTPSTAQPAAQASCAERDLQCFGDKGIVAAGVRCPRYIEGEAKHSVRWTDRTLETKFSRFRWASQGGGAITFIGDRAEFQNGFGAFTPVIYECDMPSDFEQVLAVRVREGRFPVK